MQTPSDPPDPLRYLREFRYRLSRGEALTAQQYAAEMQLSTTDELFIDLVFAEFLEREHRGDVNAREQTLAAYPACADELRLQIELHESLKNEESIQKNQNSKITQVDSKPRERNHDQTIRFPTLPGFDVLGPLGRGGMGVVLLAKELQLGRLVAIKLLLSGELSTLQHRQRFRAEARAAAALRHPNIVQVDDIGDVEGQPFIVMEYVAGGTLEEFLRQNKTTPRDAALFIRQIAWAVHAAHQAGIVHRDLKPGNVLLAPRHEGLHDSREEGGSIAVATRPDRAEMKSSLLSDYEPKITDFGLAKSLQPVEVDHAALTVKGDVLGTPCYMSPEQARGDTIGPGADVYSLGSILYEMLSGKPPFQRDTPWETVQCVLEQEPPSLSSKLPSDLRTICEKCLRKDPSERYSSMAALAVDLGNYLEGRPIDARRVGKFTRLLHWARRNVAIASSLLAVFLTLFVLLVVSLWSRWSLQEMLEETAASKRQETSALEALREQLWENILSEAQAIQSTKSIGQRYRSLENVRSAIQMLPVIGATPERVFKLRNTAIAALPLTDVEQVEIAESASGNQDFLSADSKLQRFAMRQTDGSINIVDAPKKVLLHRLPAGEADSVVISPDGSHMIVSGSSCTLQKLTDSASRRLLGQELQWPVFSPDSHLVAGHDSRSILIHDIEQNRTERLETIPIPTMPMVFSDDGNRLAVVSDERLIVTTLRPEFAVLELPGPTLSQIGNTLAWHPNGDYLAAGLYSDRIINVWHLPTRLAAKTFRVNGSFHNLHFDSTGQFLIKATLWGGTREIYAFETQASLIQLPNNVGIAFGRDESGRPLTLSNPIHGSLDAWQLENQVVTRTLEPAQHNTGQRSHCVLSSCGRWLFVNSEQGAEIYDAIRGKPAGCLPIGPLTHSGVSSLQDGELAVFKRDHVEHWMLGPEGLTNPKRLRLPDGYNVVEVSSDLRWGLCSDGRQVYLHDFTEARPLQLLGTQADTRSAAFDLNQGRVATGSWNIADGVVIWDLATGREEKRLKVESKCVVRFSPDGKFLFTSAGGGALWEVDSWKARHLNSPDASDTGFGFAFSPDSRWFVHTSGNGILKIQDLQQGSTIAVLTDPDQHHYFSLAFSSDNTSLFGINIGHDCFIKQWNLKQIDEQLKSLQLAPLRLTSDIKPKEPISYGSRLKVHGGPELGPLVEEYVRQRIQLAFTERRWADGLAELRSAILDLPENAELLTDLAWRLVTLPPEFQDPIEALATIRRALLKTNSERAQIVHAMILTQLNEFEKAFSILSRYSPEDQRNHLVIQFLKAQLSAQLGNREEAKRIFLAAQKLEFEPPDPETDLPIEDWNSFRRTVGHAVFNENPIPP